MEIIEYIPQSTQIKTMLEKSSDNISVMSFGDGEGLIEKISAHDTFVQIIDGKAEIEIGGKPFLLFAGESMIIPAHTPNKIIPHGCFKMIQTVIKSGYQ